VKGLALHSRQLDDVARCGEPRTECRSFTFKPSLVKGTFHNDATKITLCSHGAAARRSIAFLGT
jgi:hypothetical protein